MPKQERLYTWWCSKLITEKNFDRLQKKSLAGVIGLGICKIKLGSSMDVVNFDIHQRVEIQGSA